MSARAINGSKIIFNEEKKKIVFQEEDLSRAKDGKVYDVQD